MDILVISACTVFVVTWLGIAMTNEIHLFDFLNNIDLRVILLCGVMFLLQFLLLGFKNRKHDSCDVFCVGFIIVFGIFALLCSSLTILPQFKLEILFVFSLIIAIEAIAIDLYVKKYELKD